MEGRYWAAIIWGAFAAIVNFGITIVHHDNWVCVLNIVIGILSVGMVIWLIVAKATRQPHGVGDMEIKDNRELMRNKVRETCRCCGSPNVHSYAYNKPTMDCVHNLRDRLAKAEAEIMYPTGRYFNASRTEEKQ